MFTEKRFVPQFAAAVAVAIAGMTTSSSCRADWPAVLSVMPDDTQIAICTSRLDDLGDHWDRLLAAIELDVLGLPSVDELIAMVGFDPLALDGDRSLGLCVRKGNWPELDDPPILLFLPVSDYTQWLASVDSEPVGDGLATFTVSGAQKLYVRQAGSYAVLGVAQDDVGNYEPDAGVSQRLQKAVGDVGRRIVDRGDLTVIVDFDGLADSLGNVVEKALGAMSEAMAQAGQVGGDPQKVVDMYRGIVQTVLSDASGGVFSLRVGSWGVAFDKAIQWKPESEIAGFFPGSPHARNLLSQFPANPYMLAMSMDFSSIRLGKMVERFQAHFAEQGDEDMWSMGGIDIWKKSEGMAMVVYPPPAGLLGGVLNQAAIYYRGDAPALRAALKDGTLAVDGKTQQGISFTTSYESEAEEIDGTAVDTYSMQMRFPAELMQAQQAISMMYGPAGLRGFVAPAEGGILQTVSRNKKLMSELIAADRDDGLGLSVDEKMAAIDKYLPDNLSLRAYVGLGTILNQAGPMAAMFLPDLDMEELLTVSPLGLGISVSNGGIEASMVVPADLIRTGIEIGMAVRDAMGGNGGNGGGGNGPPLF